MRVFCSEDKVSGRIYYFNFNTNESTWDHPCDGVYRQVLSEERKKRGRLEGGMAPTGSKKRGSKKTRKAKKAPAGAEVKHNAHSIVVRFIVLV